jgi:cell division protein FtsB
VHESGNVMETPGDQTNQTGFQMPILTGTQFLILGIVVVGLVLALNFSSRIADGQRLRTIHQQVTDEIALLRQEQGRLIAELAYVQSDAYVDAWARSGGKMVREGEVLVVPVAAAPGTLRAGEQSPDEAVAPFLIEVALERPQVWRTWWSLFFDIPAPGA